MHVDPLRANLDCGAVWRHAPEFLDLLVRQRDAADSPILPTMKRTDPAEAISNSVNHDVRTRWDAARGRALVVLI